MEDESKLSCDSLDGKSTPVPTRSTVGVLLELRVKRKKENNSFLMMYVMR